MAKRKRTKKASSADKRKRPRSASAGSHKRSASTPRRRKSKASPATPRRRAPARPRRSGGIRKASGSGRRRPRNKVPRPNRGKGGDRSRRTSRKKGGRNARSSQSLPKKPKRPKKPRGGTRRVVQPAPKRPRRPPTVVKKPPKPPAGPRVRKPGKTPAGKPKQPPRLPPIVGDRPRPAKLPPKVLAPPTIVDPQAVLTIPPSADARVAIRNIQEAFMELIYRVGLGLGQFHRPRVVLNRDGSVDGRILIVGWPSNMDPWTVMDALQKALPPIPGARIRLDWRLGPARTQDELQELEERYLSTRSGKQPYAVSSSYYGADRWKEAFQAAKRILAALKENKRKVAGILIDIYWDPEGRYRTVRKKQPKPGYKRTWAWKPKRGRRR